MSELPFSPQLDPDEPVKGFVLTPVPLVDSMVSRLFAKRSPTPRDRVLDPGCGTGEFIEGILRWCRTRGISPPKIVGVELHAERAAQARQRFRGFRNVEIRAADFLKSDPEQFDFVIGNPPYVAITELSLSERSRFRREYATATGRFDLYVLFFEQALHLLTENGRLVFITPEKYLYVDAASSLRRLLATYDVSDLHFAPEDSFGDLVTYPIVTTVVRRTPVRLTRVRLRDGTTRSIQLPDRGESWLPPVMGAVHHDRQVTLADIATRVSCGVATGADAVFVLPKRRVPDELAPFAIDTMAGRQLTYGPLPDPTHQMLVPYDRDGHLLPQSALGSLYEYLKEPSRERKLKARTCTASKPWYAFHETPPMTELGKPKILCKDIGATPHFALDTTGSILPRHSVYYVVPAQPDSAAALCEYLNSGTSRRWLTQHCQRAAKGFLRLQSAVLKHLPVPDIFLTEPLAARTARRSA